MSLKCCLSVAYYIGKFCYLDMLYFVYFSLCLRVGLFCLIYGICFFIFIAINHIIVDTEKLAFLHDYQTFKLRVLLSFCLIFCQFYPGVGYKGVAYIKNRVCAKINSLRNISKKPIRENELLLNSKFFDWRKLLLLRYHISKWKTDMLYHK